MEGVGVRDKSKKRGVRKEVKDKERKLIVEKNFGFNDLALPLTKIFHFLFF